MDDRTIARTIRRCRGQFARPAGVDQFAMDEAIERGLLRFNEWPSGHFQITERGADFISETLADESAA